ncbi:hypothetical protein TL16_g00591 [Triparma laevis f. inornata]|uniref:RGS domain-containing protein n=1 Tax=Triparma laevis f. inornata TaxID=1714386 RepID=A0A9W6ZCJ8_9STRA|nr:hypothetical protein TL16_g00591 [Triparma laevis f. inornata]
MGGFVSTTKEPPVTETGSPKVHVVNRRRFSGRPAHGAFSAGTSTMNKIRTRSDFCLLKIFESKAVIASFGLWAQDEGASDAVKYLNFIIAINDLKDDLTRNSYGAKNERLKLMEVFRKYIAYNEDAKERSASRANEKLSNCSRIKMDSATMETITLGFESRAADKNIFDLAYEKCYQVLKFDYMPRFLISDMFLKLEAGTRSRRGSSTKVVDMAAILNEALAVDALLTYLKGKSDSKMISYTKLWVQVSTYAMSLSSDAKQYELESKAGVIQLEIKKLVDEGILRIPKGLEDPIRQKLGASVAEAAQVSKDLMNYLADILHTNVQRGFLKSKEFDVFIETAPPDFHLDSTIMHLATFKDDRQLQETKDDYVQELKSNSDFAFVWKESILSAYYRRYLRLTFCEENFFFAQECRDLSNGEHNRLRSWMTVKKEVEEDKKETNSVSDDLVDRCISIYENYIVEGRKYEINIPSKVKIAIGEKVKAGEFNKEMFHEAEVEMGRVLEFDSFDRFKKHYIYEHFKRAFFVKFSQRNFVVGDTVKGEVERFSSHRGNSAKNLVV